MDDIVETAEKLGEMIASSQRFIDLKGAEKIFEKDDQAKSLFEKFVDINNRISEMEGSGTPVEPEDKRELQSLMQKVHGNEKLQVLMKARADFAELMNRVDAGMRGKMTDG